MTVIERRLPSELTYINIHILADLQIGDANCNLPAFKNLVKDIAGDPHDYAVLLGDMMNCGLKNSKTNCYAEAMPPSKQMDLVEEVLSPITNKILGVTRGNHEDRISLEADIDPTYQICKDLGIKERYHNGLIVCKVNFGHYNGDATRPISYGLAMEHGNSAASAGASLNAAVLRAVSIENIDAYATAHSHQPTVHSCNKFFYDPYNRKLSTKIVKVAIATGWLNYGGYAETKCLRPVAIAPTCLTFSSDHKQVLGRA